MSTHVNIIPSIAEMADARVRVRTVQHKPLAAVDIAGEIAIRAQGAENIAALAAMLHRLGDELAVALEMSL